MRSRALSSIHAMIERLQQARASMSADTSLLLQNQLCYALYAASHEIVRRYRQPLASIGLTYPQYLTLLALWEGGTQTVSELSARLSLESSTLTPLLKRLEAAGFVTRQRDGGDERVVHVGVTAAGRALRRPAAAIQRRVARDTRMTTLEITRLRRQLQDLTQSLASVHAAERAHESV